MSLRAEDAHDVLQEVWVTALASPPDDGPDSNPRAWLYRVATRRALDVLARDRRRRELLAERSGRVTPEPEASPDAWVERLSEETRVHVRACVTRLPRRQREAVWLRWLEGCDYETIAARLGGSAQTARANVYQGLKQLRRQLGEIWCEEGSA
jgi:RNA polymerase sigma-70 factor (ECF subfamily)